MADSSFQELRNRSLFARLKRLFSNDVIVRNIGGKKLKVIDTDEIQFATDRNSLRDRFNRLRTSSYNQYTRDFNLSYQSSRVELFRDYDCVGPDTIIPLPDGSRPTIAELAEKYKDDPQERFYVWSYDHESKSIKLGKAYHPRSKGIQKTYKITFDNDSYIIATDNHLFLMRDETYKPVKDLRPNDSVMPFYQKDFFGQGYKHLYNFSKGWQTEHKIVAEQFYRPLNKDEVVHHINHIPSIITETLNHKIKSIEYYDEIEVYDLSVDIYNNFFTNDLCIHNCMDMDPILASALDIYADECSTRNEMGDIITVRSNNDEIKNILNNLFYDILNIEFNLWSWTRSLVKYGDFYLKLHISPEYGVYLVEPLSTYYVTRIENADLKNKNFVRFQVNLPYGNKIEECENYQIAHFRLLSDSNFLPYGKSSLEGARRVWKQLSLMEDAMLIHRIMRAPEKRIFKIDIGNIPPNEVDNHMERIINQMKKVPYIDDQTGDYNLRFNLQNMVEDFFLPVRGGDSGTSIENLSGLEWTGTDDIEYLRNKMMAALKIPKAFLGYDESLCVSPDTKIPLLNGIEKSVKELIDDYNNGIKNYVYSIDETTKNIVPGEIEWAGYTRKNADVVRVWLDNDKYIDCTPDHKFMTRDGEWIDAINLKPDQSLMPLYTKKSDKKSHSGYEMVYHPSTGKYQEVHRLVAEHYNLIQKGSRKVVHHKDFNKLNNYPENFDCSKSYNNRQTFHSKLTEININSQSNIKNKVNYKNHTVVRVEILKEKIDTCDITVKHYHNFATSAGVIIHNSGKATLAAEDIRFARTIQRIQRIIVSELNKVAVIHLYSQGYRDESLVDFSLELTNPSTIFEKEKIDVWKSKVEVSKDMAENKLFSKKWVYENVFGLSDHDMIELQKQLIDDAKGTYRFKQIEDEGNDPALSFLKSKNKEGDVSAEAGEGGSSGELGGGPDKEPTPETPDSGAGEESSAVEPPKLSERDQTGRKKASDYPFGEDPLGTLENNRRSDLSVTHKYKNKSPLSLEALSGLNDLLNTVDDERKILREGKSNSFMDETNIKE